MKKLLALAGLAALGVGLGLAASGCGSEEAVSLGKPGTTTATSTVEPAGTAASPVSLQVWFLRDGHLVQETRNHPATRLVATAAVQDLLGGPTQAGLTTAIALDRTNRVIVTRGAHA